MAGLSHNTHQFIDKGSWRRRENKQNWDIWKESCQWL